MKTGVIGLGAMGAPMALNLHQAGMLECAWNRSPEKSQKFAQESGAAIAQSPAELASRCDVVITCVSADEDLKQVIDALRPGFHAGLVIVDTSTVSVSTARQLYEQLKGEGVDFLDAPVSGGVEGARKGTLSMMVGGDAAVLEKLKPVLEKLAARIVHMGPSGSGQATKAVNQVMGAGIFQAVSEAMAFADALGLDIEKVVDVVGSGAAGNWFVNHRGVNMTRGVFDAGFRVALHHKDLLLCRQMAEEICTTEKRLPLIEMTLIHYRRLMEAGHGDEDVSALFRLKQELFKKEK